MPLESVLIGGVSGSIIDAASPNVTSDMAAFSAEINKNCVYYAYLGIIMLVASYIEMYCWVTSCERQINRLRREFFKSILHQDIAWFDQNQSGTLTTKLSDNLERMKEGMGDKLGQLIQQIAQFFAGYVIAFVYSWKLTLVMLSLMPLVIIASAVCGKLDEEAARSQQQHYAQAGAVAEEVLSCIRTVIAFNGQTREAKRYESALDKGRLDGTKKGLYEGLSMCFIIAVVFSSYGLAFWFGALEIANGNIEKGTVFVVFFSVMFGSFAIGFAAPQMALVSTARGACASILDIIEREYPVFLIGDQPPDFLRSALSLFRVFDVWMWLALLISILVFVFSLLLTRTLIKKAKEKPKQNMKLWHYFRYLAGQSVTQIREQSWAGNALVLSFGLFSTVLVSVYQGSLLTQLIKPSVRRPFGTFEQMLNLLETGKLKLILADQSIWYYQEILHSNNPYFRQLRSVLKNDSVIFEPDVSKINKLLQNPSFVFPLMSTTADYFACKYCNLHVFRAPDLPQYKQGFIFRKEKWDLKEEFDNTLMLLQQRVDTVVDKYIYRNCSCKPRPPGFTSLGLASFVGILLILFCGLATAVATFCYEFTQPKIDSYSEDGDVLEDPKGKIEFSDVHFEYPSRPDVKVLKGISFTVEPGETVALVGSSC